MAATQTAWQKKMEEKVDKLVDAITGENGTNVRLAVLETEVGEFKKNLGEVAACVKITTDRTNTNSADISSIKTSVTLHWALLLILVSGLIGIAFRVFG